MINNYSRAEIIGKKKDSVNEEKKVQSVFSI